MSLTDLLQWLGIILIGVLFVTRPREVRTRPREIRNKSFAFSTMITYGLLAHLVKKDKDLYNNSSTARNYVEFFEKYVDVENEEDERC